MDKTVKIYSTPTCHFCQMAKDFLKEKGIAYTEFDVAHDLERRQEMIQKSGQMGVPVIFIGDPSNPSGQGEMIVGFDQEKMAAALGITI